MRAPQHFDWDNLKADGNFRSHGISFTSAQAVFLDPTHVVVDTAREQDGENRQKAIGWINGRLFAVVFVMRGETCRLISARRTNRSEDRIYDHRQVDTRPE